MRTTFLFPYCIKYSTTTNYIFWLKQPPDTIAITVKKKCYRRNLYRKIHYFVSWDLTIALKNSQACKSENGNEAEQVQFFIDGKPIILFNLKVRRVGKLEIEKWKSF